MTGHTLAVAEFNRWFAGNYNILRSYCRRFDIKQDVLNDVYVNVHDRIVRSGYTTQQYLTYIKRSIRNLQINEGKKMNGKSFIDMEGCGQKVERVLQDSDEDEKDTQQYRQDVLFFSRMLFKYLMDVRNYGYEELFIFRMYYLMPGRMTYSKLSEMCGGVNKNKCTKIIRTVKDDIRQNFLTWLKENGRQGDN